MTFSNVQRNTPIHAQHLVARFEITKSLFAGYVGIQRGMVRWVDPIVDAIQDLYDPVGEVTLKVGLVTGGITR